MTDLSFLTKKDIETLESKIILTDDEKAILLHLVKSDLNDNGIMFSLNLSRNKYYKTKNNLINKIIRAAIQS